ncbi:RyR domain-containing protein [Solwaraspora sp. WMMD1047]|uniref:RyR domain-containing protein n=1 Tax=Solwaraspora sp. WMMD1047 TaxID=3016102 RepID=UPI002416E5D6|nr:RyR domain-containing protein [Solwaraspora sp. WMMD1047]MDG4831870.1 RyR domain-containing protein [Solwaraspora sp. WMMD1047]
MPGNTLGEPPRPPTWSVLRLFFVLTGVFSFVCGYLGLADFLNAHPEFSDRPLDLIYYTLQLFVLGSPPLDEGGKDMPVLLDLARFTAPTVTAYALAEAGRLLFANELRRIRNRNARGHVIVCGDGLVAATLARRLRATGRRVVAVPADAVATEPRSPRITGTARDPDLLRDAGIARASAVYACTDDSAANTAIALTAARRGRSPLAAYAQVADPELCLALQARHLGLARPDGARLDFFNIDDLAARKLFSQEPLLPVRGNPPVVVILGATAFGRSVLVELARRWRVIDSEQPAKVRIALIDEQATEAAAELSHRYPFLGQVCRIDPFDGGLPELLSGSGFPLPPDRVFICYDDEEQALKTALTTEQLWHGGYGSVLVRLDRLANLREAFGSDPGNGVLDDLSGALRLYGVVHAACDPDLIGDDLVERLARVIHESYVMSRRRRGEQAIDNPALVPWEELPEPQRRANRAQARDIGRKLRELGCALSPRVGPGDEHALAEEEIEKLAELEHERWRAEKVASGWRYADDRDDVHLLHPALSRWESLREDMRVRNHDAIRELPVQLADAGFRIVRVRRMP